MAWEVQERHGLWLPQIGWWLDARYPVARSFVSHAHFDHLAGHDEILCSAGTARLSRARLPARRIEHVLPFGHCEALTEDCSVTLHPAGHIHGSAQILLQHQEHGSLLYTGDFKLRPGLSAEPCATPHADLLVMETTFGKPEYRFPPTEQVLAAIQQFCRETLEDGETPVLFGYSLGKSQEILSSLASAQLPVMLHPETFRLTRVYEELGLKFPPYREFVAAEVAGHVVLCPPLANTSGFMQRIGAGRRCAMLTGWALDPGAIHRYQCDAAFPLSDHADFPDLLRFVERVQPQRVLTVHGFTEEFARTLRDRGIEAWALGRFNQLSLGLGLPDSPEPGITAAASASPPESGDSSPRGPADSSLSLFAATADAIRATSSKLQKVRLLAEYLRRLPDDDAARAALYFTGRAFPPAEDRALHLGWAVLKRAVLAVSSASEQDLRSAYRRFADSGEAAALVLAGRTRPAQEDLPSAAKFFGDVADARGPLAKLDLVADYLRRLSPSEAKYVIKVVTGDLRVGLKEGLVEEAIALSTGETVEAVRAASLLCGDLALVMRCARGRRLADIELRVFRPLQFMLASPEPTAEAILARLAAPVWIEEKYDGIRCQIHKQGTRVEIYSRDLHSITGQFPDVAASAARLPGDFIADGELLAWRDGRALPFAELQRRLGRQGDDFFLGQELPVSVSLYDLLWRDDRTLLREPLRERRRQLADLLADPPARFLLAPVQQANSAVEIESAFLAARKRGNEGLMAKDPDSPYTPGRRGLAWLKLKKAYATLDVVVVAAELGHGKRRDVLSDYTFAIRDPEHDRLLTVGKAYSGLTDAEIAELTRHFIAHTIEEKGRVRTVVPDVVLEIAFDSIQRSNRHQSGYALRFPRINRIRTDKTVAEIDTLETCRRLAGDAV